MLKIAYDVMGSDNGVKVSIQAAQEFIEKKDDLFYFLVGDQKEIKSALKEFPMPEGRYEIVHTDEFIEQTGSILDIRRKPNASMVKVFEMVKDKKADAMISAGNSGAFIAAAHLILGEIPGVTRPGFMPMLPTPNTGEMMALLDGGANVENSVEDLVQYSKLGSVYMEEVLGIKSPRIGLMNIGAESGKGKELQKEVFKQLSEIKDINFVGNVEPREVLNGVVHIFVCDGFSGNLVAKTAEGVAKTLLTELKKELTKNIIRKLAALVLKPAFKQLQKSFDYKNYGGTILIGVDGLAFKSHGSSDVALWNATLRITYDAIKNDVLSKMKKRML